MSVPPGPPQQSTRSPRGGRENEVFYTLADAKVELNRLECLTRGHDYRILLSPLGPESVICERCGAKWNIEHEKPNGS